MTGKLLLGEACVNNTPSFVGRRAEHMLRAVHPASPRVAGPSGGILPLGSAHPDTLACSVIAANITAAMGSIR